MATHTPIKPDESEIERAQDMWVRFTVFSKYAIIATVLTLGILGLVFIDW